MDYKFINLTKVNMDGLVPPHIKKIIKEHVTFPFIAIENGKAEAILIFTIKPSDRHKCFLIYNHVTEAHAHDNTLDNLLSFAEDTLSFANMNSIGIQMNSDPDTLEATYDLLTTNDYTIINSNERFLLYFLQDILDSSFADTAVQMGPEIKNVKKYSEITDDIIRRFNRKMKTDGAHSVITYLDKFYSRFYVEDNDIKAILDVKKLHDNIFSLSVINADSNAGFDKTLLLIASLFNDESDRLPEDTLFMTILNSTKDYDKIISVFGSAETDEMMIELTKDI